MWEKTTILHHYYSLEISTALLEKKKKSCKTMYIPINYPEYKDDWDCCNMFP